MAPENVEGRGVLEIWHGKAFLPIFVEIVLEKVG
jgi:hypothetical protein